MNGFKLNMGPRMTLTDRETKVEVNILPGGGKVDPGPLTLPILTKISDEPQLLTLEKLISSKLSTSMGRGIQRAQDYADVAKLIEANRLPRDFSVTPQVLELYQKMWDEMRDSS